MHSKVFLALTFLLNCLAVRQAFSQQTFYDDSVIQKVEIKFSQPDWDMMLDTAKYGADGYLMSEWVKINGIQFDSAGVKYKGNSSYDSTYSKNPVHIALDEFTSNAYQGFTDIKLGNGYADPSQVREVLAYDILRSYMDCPRANFAQLYINGAYMGLYSNVESINKEFCSDHFYSSQNTFIKCNPVTNPGPATKSNLKHIALADSTAYFNFYEIKSESGWNELVSLCDTVTNVPSSISNVFDMDRVLWMLAFNNVLVNLDSYTGVFCQNYYLYKDNTGHYNPVVWDLNMAFGGFPYVGNLNNSMGSLTIANMQQLSLSIHAADPYWPLINDVMNNAVYKRMYVAHMRTLIDEMFAGNDYVTLATQLQALADTAVQSDTNGFFSYAQFQAGMTANNTVGSYQVPGISNLMGARVSYLQSTTEFSAAQPVISSVTASDTLPQMLDTVTITASVINANSNAVFLGYRYDHEEKFTRILMVDDGMHNDGAAGDNIYGVSMVINSIQCQYYIYAENSNAGIFSPERAEHEFYVLQSDLQIPVAGQVMINEFLAINQNGVTDESGQHEDWIEFFNTTNTPLNLYGLYLTDNYSNPFKFAFPQNTIIQPDSTLVIWADEDSSTSSYVHCNFKLSGNGEELLLSNAAGDVLDSISFGPQTADVSLGRCPDGTGVFAPRLQPSFNAKNCVTGIEEINPLNYGFSVYPNPAASEITIEIHGKTKSMVVVTDATGRQIFVKEISQVTEKIPTGDWHNGVYFFRMGYVNQKVMIIH